MNGESVLRLKGIVTDEAHVIIIDPAALLVPLQSYEAEFQLSRSVRLAQGKDINDAEEAQVILGCKLNGDTEGEARENGRPFWVHVQVVGHFDISQVDVKEREQMLLINAVAIVFPYLRAAMSALTSVCGLPPVTLPVFNVPAVFRDQPATIEEALS